MGTQFTWNILSENEYKNQRWEFIQAHENTKMTAYIDTNEKNIPTIGVGFNLMGGNILDLVIKQIFYGEGTASISVRDTDANIFSSQIRTALNHNSSDDALQSALNEVMQDGADYWNDVIAEAEDGFVMLAEFDSNADGVIDANDAQFNQLKAWQDTNNDGFSQTPELHSLADLDIALIDLNYTDTDYHLAGNHVRSEFTFTKTDNSTYQIVDAWFAYNNVNTVYKGEATLDVRTFFLPTARGYGNMADLHIAMSQDESLLDMVADIAGATVGDIPACMSGAQNSAFQAGVSEKAGYLRIV